MLKLSRLLLHSSRDHFSSQSMLGVAANDFKLLRGIATQAWGASTSTPNLEPSASRIFAPYSIFKGKAALCADPLLPKFTKKESGDYRIERQGSIMLTFWPAIGERRYDWEKRQKFALSATEVGSLINLGAKDSCEFFHDPSMKSSNAGQVRKNLSVKAHADGSGYFVSLNVVSNVLQTNDRFVVPVTAAEFAVMRTAFSFALPHIMGWDRTLCNLPMHNNGGSSAIHSKQVRSKAAPEAQSNEWDR